MVRGEKGGPATNLSHSLGYEPASRALSSSVTTDTRQSVCKHQLRHLIAAEMQGT